MRRIWNNARRSVWTPWIALVLVAALLAYPTLTDAPSARGEIKESPRPEAFRSGAERSEVVLREIAETLRRIDTRLERFEQALRATDSERPVAEDGPAPKDE